MIAALGLKYIQAKRPYVSKRASSGIANNRPALNEDGLITKGTVAN